MRGFTVSTFAREKGSGCHHFTDHLRKEHLRDLSQLDNQTTATYINQKKGTQKVDLNIGALWMPSWTEHHLVSIRVLHIKGSTLNAK